MAVSRVNGGTGGRVASELGWGVDMGTSGGRMMRIGAGKGKRSQLFRVHGGLYKSDDALRCQAHAEVA
ncbi:hypothetical protein GCM10028796_18720 [Ramlibacter monticola]